MKTSATLLVLGAALALQCTLWPAHATLRDYQIAVTNEAAVISYYTFDKANAADALGRHPGTTQGGATFKPGANGVDSGLQLSGTGRVNLGRVEDFDFADGTGSVEAWVRVDWSGSLTYNPAIFVNRNGGPVTWSLHMNGDKSAVGIWNGMAYQTRPIPNPGTRWHHLAVVFNSGEMVIYWDGASLGTLFQGLGTGASTTQMGSSSATATAEGWVGMFDEVAFYSDALSAAQVLAHYQAFFAGTPPEIKTQPKGNTCLVGVPLRLSVAASGPNLSYQWHKNGSSLAGKTEAALSFAALAAGDAGTYHVVVSNPAANVPSSNAVVTVASELPAAVALYQTAVTNEPSLISYYPFDRLEAKDAQGLHDGTLQGSAYFGPGLGSGPDQALLLDGAGHVALDFVSDFDFTDGTGTVEAWVQAGWGAEMGYNPALISDRDGGLTTWSIHVGSDKRSIGMWNGMNYRAFPIPDASTNWHHVAVIYDAGSMTIYWDGLALETVTHGPSGNIAPVQIGSSAATTTAEGWIGLIDEVAFHAEALSDESVQAHYKAFFATSAPVITVQPVGGAFYTGRALQLLVGATGADLQYQWYKNSASMSGETNRTLTFAALAPGDAGIYYVSVSNAGGTVKSDEVQLQVGNNLAPYQGAVRSESSLISYYTFDVGDAKDSKGTNDGVGLGTVSFGGGVGQGSDQALVLDGTGNINVGLVEAFDFTNGNGTVEAWIRPEWSTDPGYDPCLFANRVASSFQVDWSIHMNRNRDAIGSWNGMFYQTRAVGGTAGWHHYAIVFGDGQVAMYWDGQPLGTFAQPIAMAAGLSTQIGSSDPLTTTEGWIGGLDEIAFYNTTLSAAAIQNHFLAMVGVPTTAPRLSYSRSGSNLTLSWPAETVGYILESAEQLPGSSWTAVPGVVNNQVTVTISGTNRFYRLRK
jgi:hypothetical protein